MRERYRDAADSILANSTAKVFMGPVTDETTRRYLAALLGDEITKTTSTTRRNPGDPGSVTIGQIPRPKAHPAALQQLGPDRGVVVEGAHPPAVVTLAPYWSEWRA